MGETDLVEQYQGVIIATSLDFPTSDNVFYAPSQRKEFEEYTNMGHLPDGRRVVQSTWLESPIDRNGLDLIVLDLLASQFPIAEGLGEEDGKKL